MYKASEVNEIASFNLGDFGELVVKSRGGEYESLPMEDKKIEEQSTNKFSFAEEDIQNSVRARRMPRQVQRSKVQDLSPLSRFVHERKKYNTAPPEKAVVPIRRTKRPAFRYVFVLRRPMGIFDKTFMSN